MTTQDWSHGLQDDEEPAGHRRRGRLLAGGMAIVVALAALVLVVQHASAPRPAVAAAPTTSSAPASAPAEPDSRAVVIRADLSDPGVTGGYPLAPLVVGTQPVQGGVAPERVPHFDSCQADPATLHPLANEIRRTSATTFPG